MGNKEQNNGEIGKEPDMTNPEDLSEYIQPFMDLFNKNKFKKLPELLQLIPHGDNMK